jgi:hypothetical protein
MTTTEALGRFGHHPNPAVDFCCEVDALEGYAAEYKAGGFGIDKAALTERIARALTFVVGGDEHAVAAKGQLRRLEDSLAPKQGGG